MTLIGLVRHGQTDWNLNNIFQGASDVPLNATGIEQAHHALDFSPALPWDFVMSSPLIRARRTAEIIAADHNLRFTGVHEGFREVDFGWAEGKPTADAYEAYPQRDFPAGKASMPSSSAHAQQCARCRRSTPMVVFSWSRTGLSFGTWPVPSHSGTSPRSLTPRSRSSRSPPRSGESL